MARNLEFFRDRSTLIFNLVFPIVLIFGFACAFPGGGRHDLQDRHLRQPAGRGQPGRPPLPPLQIPAVRPLPGLDVPLDRLAHHQIDMVLDFSKDEYYVNDGSSNGYVLERMLAHASAAPAAFRASRR